VKPKPETSLKARAMQLLARREHSRAELRARLLPHVQEGEDIDAVLDELVKRNWLSDARAAEQLVNGKRARFGTQRIAHELRRKGIAEDMIGDALPHLKDTELEAARSVWQKKFGVPPQESALSASARVFHGCDLQGVAGG
jgi:regulatory protein